ncbi:MAG TPA: hypothetical protein VHH36_07805 [Candidatus Thermoplasmatota archaeon]|nr:hypothetical protein [Candidatus Thermoplasmatota archaeon]
MDPTCRFAQEYLPTAAERDPVLDLHVSHCPDCQEQTFRLGDA